MYVSMTSNNWLMSPDKLSMIRWMGCWCCLASASPDEGGMKVRKNPGDRPRKKTRRCKRGGRIKGEARRDDAAPPTTQHLHPVGGQRRKRAFERRQAFSARSVKICRNLNTSISKIDSRCKEQIGKGRQIPRAVRQKRHTLMLNLHKRKAAWIAFQVKVSQDSLTLIKARYSLLVGQLSRFEYDSDLDSETEQTNLSVELARPGEGVQELARRLEIGKRKVEAYVASRPPEKKARPPKGMLSRSPELDEAWRIRPDLRGKPPCRHCGFAICRCATRVRR
jgi:hypothetical protein